MNYEQTEEQKQANQRESTRQQLAAFLWRREGGPCVSMLVSTLAQGYGNVGRSIRHSADPGADDLAALCEQAMELASPVPDYEEAVADYIRSMERVEVVELLDSRGVEYSGGDKTETLRTELLADIDGDEGAEDFGRDARVDPYDREVFEHWLVSDWLAGKLTAAGEKCDKDFAGLTVWARCTTGQSIVLDGVMQSIALELWPTEEDRKRILARD